MEVCANFPQETNSQQPAQLQKIVEVWDWSLPQLRNWLFSISKYEVQSIKSCNIQNEKCEDIQSQYEKMQEKQDVWKTIYRRVSEDEQLPICCWNQKVAIIIIQSQCCNILALFKHKFLHHLQIMCTVPQGKD
jgi:hypothetical protein